ncbi:MAG: hypothetical protein IJJ10_03275 [Bacillus sp. (in: Bacteria)]|nr:hypothetical protein [Bacillus sp. (in: firmicutes)]
MSSTTDILETNEFSRYDLHLSFIKILGNENVYFQPPESKKLKYPCIIYNLAGIDKRHADNDPYRSMKRYRVTVVDQDPDSVFPDKVNEMRLCSFVTHFNEDYLNHWVFEIYHK